MARQAFLASAPPRAANTGLPDTRPVHIADQCGVAATPTGILNVVSASPSNCASPPPFRQFGVGRDTCCHLFISQPTRRLGSTRGSGLGIDNTLIHTSTIAPVPTLEKKNVPFPLESGRKHLPRESCWCRAPTSTERPVVAFFYGGCMSTASLIVEHIVPEPRRYTTARKKLACFSQSEALGNQIELTDNCRVAHASRRHLCTTETQRNRSVCSLEASYLYTLFAMILFSKLFPRLYGGNFHQSRVLHNAQIEMLRSLTCTSHVLIMQAINRQRIQITPCSDDTTLAFRTFNK